MDTNASQSPQAPSSPMTQEELNEVVQQILRAQRGEGQPPDAATLARAYDTIRVNRAAASSRRAAGPSGKAVSIPVDLNELF